MDLARLLGSLSAAPLLSVAVGLLLMVAVLWLLGKALPFSLKAAISEKRNDAVSVIIFSVLVGLGIILSATLDPDREGAGASAEAAGSASAAPAGSAAPATSGAKPKKPRR